MRLDHLLSKVSSRDVFYCLVIKEDNEALLVAMRPGATPVPIPNTMVKTGTADDTALATVWESRWLPESLYKDKTL